MVPVREVFQNGFGIVADSSQFDALIFESRLSALQLDQLPFAIRSPVRRTEEEENRAFRSFERIQILAAAQLIDQRESWRALATLEPD